ncbi:LytR/AlgR family response regulator transcription factor [Sediminicola luteus]|uniref:DNA-binding response regulator n=1 Tax=Sediminicola luteus TaxID=319238 RepID=A0A2A4G5Y0_9FLAO|nr:LytTR family DNA-binding domain-containing protein [Sediminicola luteus]PCE63831.1 hypothetical protein B7P33_11210 [Sediminicola luteus]
MKALLIDDEERARNLLRIMLETHCPEITSIQMAPNLPEGVACIKSFKPDVVFLDIEMPNYSGLELFQFISVEEIDFELVFTTAYRQYALQAFELHAIDYLLKPIMDDKLGNAVAKVMKRRQKQENDQRLAHFKNYLSETNNGKIGFPVGNGIRFERIQDIVFMEAERMYTHVHIEGEKPFLVCKPLKHYIDLLQEDPSFFRSHRSFLINMNHIRSYVNDQGTYIVMRNGEQAVLSRSKKNEFLQLIEEWC